MLPMSETSVEAPSDESVGDMVAAMDITNEAITRRQVMQSMQLDAIQTLLVQVIMAVNGVGEQQQYMSTTVKETIEQVSKSPMFRMMGKRITGGEE